MEPHVRSQNGLVFRVGALTTHPACTTRMDKYTRGTWSALTATFMPRHMVSLDRVFHADLLFMKWVIDHGPLQAGETLSAPCYSALKRLAKRHHLLDASVEAVGGCCVEKSVYWRYDLPKELTAELQRKDELRKTCTVATNLLRIVGMVVTAWVMLELVGDRPAFEENPVIMRADNVTAVS